MIVPVFDNIIQMFQELNISPPQWNDTNKTTLRNNYVTQVPQKNTGGQKRQVAKKTGGPKCGTCDIYYCAVLCCLRHSIDDESCII